MERELMPDYVAEEFYQYLIPPQAFGGAPEFQKKANHCIVFCTQVAPDVFNISKGIAVVKGVKKYFNDGVCMIVPASKVVFVFEKTAEKELQGSFKRRMV